MACLREAAHTHRIMLSRTHRLKTCLGWGTWLGLLEVARNQGDP